MLLWVDTITNPRRPQNVVKTLLTNSVAPCVLLFCSYHIFDMICDLLLNRCQALWILIVNCIPGVHQSPAQFLCTDNFPSSSLKQDKSIIQNKMKTRPQLFEGYPMDKSLSGGQCSAFCSHLSTGQKFIPWIWLSTHYNWALNVCKNFTNLHAHILSYNDLPLLAEGHQGRLYQFCPQ